MRYPLVDQIRGMAVALMVFFHFFYDMNLFRFVEIDFYNDLFWFGLPRLIVFLFLIAVGLSLCIAHTPKVNWKKFGKRWAILASLAFSISLITYLLFPERWVYFGTLHCIAVCSLIGIFFLRHPKTSLALAATLLIPHISGIYSYPWIKLNHQAMDYIPALPWVGVLLIAIFLYHKNFHLWIPPKNKLTDFLTLLGKHALVIYMAHQPLLFGFSWLCYQLKVFIES
jgi:uncharacterized membrane protein